ncbi:UNVERIFIED_CONTAM: hypothetical protein K2H54_059176 [Gekko kuhli]
MAQVSTVGRSDQGVVRPGGLILPPACRSSHWRTMWATSVKESEAEMLGATSMGRTTPREAGMQPMKTDALLAKEALT